jgi:hypothetical protein
VGHIATIACLASSRSTHGHAGDRQSHQYGGDNLTFHARTPIPLDAATVAQVAWQPDRTTYPSAHVVRISPIFAELLPMHTGARISRTGKRTSARYAGSPQNLRFSPGQGRAVQQRSAATPAVDGSSADLRHAAA